MGIVKEREDLVVGGSIGGNGHKETGLKEPEWTIQDLGRENLPYLCRRRLLDEEDKGRYARALMRSAEHWLSGGEAEALWEKVYSGDYDIVVYGGKVMFIQAREGLIDGEGEVRNIDEEEILFTGGLRVDRLILEDNKVDYEMLTGIEGIEIFRDDLYAAFIAGEVYDFLLDQVQPIRIEADGVVFKEDVTMPLEGVQVSVLISLLGRR